MASIKELLEAKGKLPLAWRDQEHVVVEVPLSEPGVPNVNGDVFNVDAVDAILSEEYVMYKHEDKADHVK